MPVPLPTSSQTGWADPPSVPVEALNVGEYFSVPSLTPCAFAVVVGSAITRPEHVTGWFVDALAGGADAA